MKKADKPPIKDPQGSDEEMLLGLQSETYDYFKTQFNTNTGLITDRTESGSPGSIAAVGLGLTCDVVACSRSIVTRKEAVARTLTTLRFLSQSPQSESPEASGYKGFFYHFLDMTSGRRAENCELSTIDTALLMAGVLTVGLYFDQDVEDEKEIQRLSDFLYERVEWTWMLNDKGFLSHGWTPEKGFLKSDWDKEYSEAMILYVLALGSSKFSIPESSYPAWTSTFELKTCYEQKYIYAGPLFIHQLSHVWLNFDGIQDALNRKIGFDYFENSRRATQVHRAYAKGNPHDFEAYSENNWGLTACNGPGPKEMTIKGVHRKFFGYTARGAPYGPDDGTLSPWAVVASLPFAPSEVLEALRHSIERLELKGQEGGGLEASYNPTFPEREDNDHAWVAPWRIGLNQGPIILMIENHFSRLIWNLMERCPPITKGLKRAGFEGGWLEA